jgi:hypothetical protein
MKSKLSGLRNKSGSIIRRKMAMEPFYMDNENHNKFSIDTDLKDSPHEQNYSPSLSPRIGVEKTKPSSRIKVQSDPPKDTKEVTRD